MNGTLLFNSLAVAFLTTLLSCGLGLVAALAWLISSRFCRRLLMLSALVALMLPPFLVTNAWLRLAGPGGRWESVLPASVTLMSLQGTVWILTLLTWPISFLFVRTAWNRIERAHLECDPALRKLSLVQWLLWPLVRPYLGWAALVILVLVLNQFDVPAILQVKVLPAAMWVEFNTTFNYAAAFRSGWPLVAAPLILLALMRFQRIEWSWQEGSVPPSVLRERLGRGLAWASGLITTALVGVSGVLPVLQLVGSERTWSEFSSAFRASPFVIWNSFWLAASTATVCLILAWMSWRLRWAKLLWVFFLIPGLVLGMVLIPALNRPILDPVYQSGALVVLAWTLRYLALSWQGLRLGMRTVDPDLTDAARLNGGSGWTRLRHVEGPQIAPLALAAWYVTYLLCLWDVETLILIVPPGGETLALRIFNLLHYGHNTQVDALCLILLILAVLPWFILWLGRRFFATMSGNQAAS
jgi:iron(III) transport system permease protein